MEVGKDLGDRAVQPPAHSRVNQSRLLRTGPSGVLKISKDRDTLTSLGNLPECIYI